jgi:hypothetical protein
VSGTLLEHAPAIKSSSPRRVHSDSAINGVQTPREQIIAARGISSYLADKCGISITPIKKASEILVQHNSETARSNAGTEADVLQPRPPHNANLRHQDHSPLQQLRQRLRID